MARVGSYYMFFKNVVIESLAYSLPEEVCTSHAIEKQLSPLYQRLKLPEGRLELMTGIQERRLWPKGTKPSEAASMAAKKALEQSKIKPEDIAGNYIVDYAHPGVLITSETAVYLKSEGLKTPMASGLAAFAGKMEMDRVKTQVGGEVLTWEDVKKSF